MLICNSIDPRCEERGKQQESLMDFELEYEMYCTGVFISWGRLNNSFNLEYK